MKSLRLVGILALILALCFVSACKKEEVLAEADTTPLIIVANTPIPTKTPEATPSGQPDAPESLTFPTKGYCNGEGVNIRSQPGRDASIIDIMGENTVLNIVSLQDGWYRVDLDGQSGYISEGLVTLGDPPRKDNMHWARVKSSSAKLYKSPSTAEPSEVTLNKGDMVKVLRKLGDYLHVVYNGNLQRYIRVSAIEYITEAEFKGGTPPPSSATPAP